jgi:small nuclear ribonucleoprotein (snRNP)-like protein
MATKRESAIDLAKMVDKGVRVKLAGGREGARRAAHASCLLPAACSLRLSFAPVNPPPSPPPGCPPHTNAFETVSGILKGYDQLLNVVLDDAVEYLRGAGGRGMCSVFGGWGGDRRWGALPSDEPGRSACTLPADLCLLIRLAPAAAGESRHACFIMPAPLRTDRCQQTNSPAMQMRRIPCG